MPLSSTISRDNDEGGSPQRPPLRHCETHESTYYMPYANYAFWVGREPTFAIFRRFASINSLNLLALQAEICHEEHILKTLQLEDDQTDNHTNFLRLMEAENGSNGWKQWRQIQKLRSMLKEYNALLFENQRLFQLPKPNPSDRQELIKSLVNRSTGTGSFLEYPENIFEQIDGKDQFEDLITLYVDRLESTDKADKFTCWAPPIVFHKVLPWVHDHFHKILHSMPYIEFEDDKIDRAIGSVTAVIPIAVASILPTASIFALYFIPTTVFRLAFITIFSFIFTLALEIFTTARKIEIFTAAVALASVQAVFISTQSC